MSEVLLNQTEKLESIEFWFQDNLETLKKDGKKKYSLPYLILEIKTFGFVIEFEMWHCWMSQSLS